MSRFQRAAELRIYSDRIPVIYLRRLLRIQLAYLGSLTKG
jgi:hypothetical protein